MEDTLVYRHLLPNYAAPDGELISRAYYTKDEQFIVLELYVKENKPEPSTGGEP